MPRRIVTTVTPTVQISGAYTAGYSVGAVQSIAPASIAAGLGVKLDSITVTDAANQKAAITVLFFAKTPPTATVTDNVAFAWGSDLPLCIGKVDIAAADYETFNSKAIACKTDINLDMVPAGTTLFAVLVTTGTPTYVAATGLTLTFGLEQSQ